jgi:hypothetical protein
MTRLPSLLPYCNQVIGAKALSIAPPIGKALGLMPRKQVIMAHTDKDQPTRLLPYRVTPRTGEDDGWVILTPKYGYHKKTSRLMRSKFRCGTTCKCLLGNNTRAKEKREWLREAKAS